MSRFKPRVAEITACLECGGSYTLQPEALACMQCNAEVPLRAGIPLFTLPPPGLQPSPKLARGPDVGTPWRQANWRFLQEQIESLPPQAVILDVGAGRGDFAALLAGRLTLALDVYPYPEVDLVCDLTQVNPFRPASFDAILLMNVLEHIYNTHSLLSRLSSLLKPGGILLVAIPFMVKMHQVPLDFVRYTHFALDRLGSEHGLRVEQLAGFYDPHSLLGEGLGNLKHSVLPSIRGASHYTARLLLLALQALANALKAVIGPGQVQSPAESRSQSPTGYHIVYRKGS